MGAVKYLIYLLSVPYLCYQVDGVQRCQVSSEQALTAPLLAICFNTLNKSVIKVN